MIKRIWLDNVDDVSVEVRGDIHLVYNSFIDTLKAIEPRIKSNCSLLVEMTDNIQDIDVKRLEGWTVGAMSINKVYKVYIECFGFGTMEICVSAFTKITDIIPEDKKQLFFRIKVL